VAGSGRGPVMQGTVQTQAEEGKGMAQVFDIF